MTQVLVTLFAALTAVAVCVAFVHATANAAREADNGLIFSVRYDGRGGPRRRPSKSSSTMSPARAAELAFAPKRMADVRRWLRKLGARADQLDDIAGDVWLAVVSSWHAYDPKQSRPERWINRITRNVWSKERERARHWREVPLEQAPRQAFAVYDADPHDERDRQRIAFAAQELVEATPDGDIVAAHDLDGRSVKEIAAELGISESGLYKRRTRALAAMAREPDADDESRLAVAWRRARAMLR